MEFMKLFKLFIQEYIFIVYKKDIIFARRYIEDIIYSLDHIRML